ncbi:unnamed protein product, partial [Ixodes hexagonus]
YEVPSGFCPVKENPLSLDNVATDEKRIWLFQMPNEVNVADLDGLEIPLRGSDENVVRIAGNSYTLVKTAETEYTKGLSMAALSKEDGHNFLVPCCLAGSAVLTKKAELPEGFTPKVFTSQQESHANAAHRSARQRFTPFGSGR